MAERIQKIDSHTFRMTSTETVTRERVMSIGDLLSQRENYQKSLDDYTEYASTEIARIDALIAEAKKAGVKESLNDILGSEKRGLYDL
jgi:hypothetical protein